MLEVDVQARPGAPRECLFCREPLAREASAACSACGVAVHATCAEELSGCPTLGCGGVLAGPAGRRAPVRIVPQPPRAAPPQPALPPPLIGTPPPRRPPPRAPVALRPALLALTLGVVLTAAIGVTLWKRERAARDRVREAVAQLEGRERAARAGAQLASQRWLRVQARRDRVAGLRATRALLEALSEGVEDPAVSDAVARCAAFLAAHVEDRPTRAPTLLRLPSPSRWYEPEPVRCANALSDVVAQLPGSSGRVLEGYLDDAARWATRLAGGDATPLLARAQARLAAATGAGE